MRSELTERQNQVHEYLRSYIRDNGRPPTIKEIGTHLAIRSTNGVYKLLVALEKKGLIERTAHEARGLRLIDTAPALALEAEMPSVYAPRPTVRADTARRPLPRAHQPFVVDPRLLGSGVDIEHCVAIVASDDGLMGDGIRKGDVVVVQEMEWSELEDGCLVGVYRGERLLVRHYEYAGGRVHLKASDRTYENEVLPPNSEGLYIIGRARALLRRL